LNGFPHEIAFLAGPVRLAGCCTWAGCPLGKRLA